MCYKKFAEIEKWRSGPSEGETESEWKLRSKNFTTEEFVLYFVDRNGFISEKRRKLADLARNVEGIPSDTVTADGRGQMEILQEIYEEETGLTLEYEKACTILDKGFEIDWEQIALDWEVNEELAEAQSHLQEVLERWTKVLGVKRSGYKSQVSRGNFKRIWFDCYVTNQPLETFAKLIGSPVANCKARAKKLGLPPLDRKPSRWENERLLHEVLSELGVEFDIQWSTPDCRSKYRALSFDFAGCHNGQRWCIEYHGEQHYHPEVFKAWVEETKAKDSFDAQQERDALKHAYCTTFKVPYLVIDYSQKKRTKELVVKFLKDIGVL